MGWIWYVSLPNPTAHGQNQSNSSFKVIEELSLKVRFYSFINGYNTGVNEVSPKNTMLNILSLHISIIPTLPGIKLLMKTVSCSYGNTETRPLGSSGWRVWEMHTGETQSRRIEWLEVIKHARRWRFEDSQRSVIVVPPWLLHATTPASSPANYSN